MLRACNEILERVGRKQPDWFTAAQSSHKPLKHFLAKAVSSSKNMWLCKKILSIQAHGRFRGYGIIFVLSVNFGQVAISSQFALIPLYTKCC